MVPRKEERPPTLAYDHNFCRVTAVDGMSVTLAYDLDPERWPWLSLPPLHPVLIEKYQYFSTVTAAWVTQEQVPGIQSALTQMTWRCEPASFAGKHATQGSCRLWQNTRDGGFELSTFNKDHQRVTHYTGTGFSFTDRDFKAWRAKTRQAALAQAGSTEIEFANPRLAGLDANGLCFVSRMQEKDGQPFVAACVSTQRGFHPTHPFHTGSGDHVNAGHLFDCAMQAAHVMLKAATPMNCTGGVAEFKRFIELDVPFTIRQTSKHHNNDEAQLSMAMEQLGRENTLITLKLTSQEPETS